MVIALFALLAVAVLASPALAANIRLTDSGFSPSESTISAGETVVWTNGTESTQTIVGADGTWDSGPLGPGETFSVQLRQPGTIAFRTSNGTATGSIRVAAAASTAQTPVDPEEPAGPALPLTGIPVLLLAALGALLVAVGTFAVTRSQRT